GRRFSGKSKRRRDASTCSQAQNAHQPAEGLGGNFEKGRPTALRALRSAAYLRYQVERGRRRRSRSDADASAGGCRGIQTVQPCQVGYDARGARQTGSSGEQAAKEFSHGAAQLTGFSHGRRKSRTRRKERMLQ